MKILRIVLFNYTDLLYFHKLKSVFKNIALFLLSAPPSFFEFSQQAISSVAYPIIS